MRIIVNSEKPVIMKNKKQNEKISASFLSILIMVVSIISCDKDSDDSTIPETPEVKPVAWAVGDQDSTNHAAVFYSADTGNTWTRQGANADALSGMDALNLFVIDTNQIWVVGSNRSIARTTDGGSTWESVNPPDVDPASTIECISVVNGSEIWISGGNLNTGFVCTTSDEGENWTVIEKDFFQGFLMQGILAINGQVIYAVGNNSSASAQTMGRICRTTDGGTTWDTISLAENYNKVASWIGVAATNENHVVVYGQTNHYAFTTNGGTTWTNDTLMDASTGTADINHLIMLDDQTWWAAMDMGNILKTNDGGQTWTHQGSNCSGNMFLMGIDAYNEDLAIVTGQAVGWPPSGKILQTNDGGNTWMCPETTDFSMLKVTFAPH